MGRTRTVAALLASALGLAVASASPTPVAVEARIDQDENRAMLVFDLSQPVVGKAYALRNPERIIVDLPEVKFRLDPTAGRPTPIAFPIVKGFRFGALGAGKSRIVIDLARLACPASVKSEPIFEGAPASRLKIELKPCDPDAFAALGSPPPEAANAANPSRLSAPVVVLDPGHGGADGGAHGVGGVLEKTLVFAFCAELKRQLEAEARYKIVLTREGDRYVDLDDRVEIARQADADLFISVHADMLGDDPSVSGSTVYTAADRASDAEAARIAARENAADRAPARASRPLEDPGVADILFDLKRRETRAYAHIFSRGLVDKLREKARLNSRPERSAGFVVLKAPEFPSILLELGYLSNPQDVQSLSSPEWRSKAAAAIVRAIDGFFADSPFGADGHGVALGVARPAPNR